MTQLPKTPAGLFAANLGVYMQDRGLTTAAVARRAGLSAAAVYNYIHGPSLPRLSKRPHLAAALGVTVDELNSWQNEPASLLRALVDNPLEDTVAEIRGALLKMSPQRWPIVVEVVRDIGRIE